MVARNQDTINEETRVRSSETEEDMKEYLQQVIEEVKKDRRKP
jgi:endo-beta-N-acetylglucosaminidase D